LAAETKPSKWVLQYIVRRAKPLFLITLCPLLIVFFCLHGAWLLGYPSLRDQLPLGGGSSLQFSEINGKANCYSTVLHLDQSLHSQSNGLGGRENLLVERQILQVLIGLLKVCF
jgi:hypothetical protein